MSLIAGIDIGSSTIKCALLSNDQGSPEILAKVVERIRRRDAVEVLNETYDGMLAEFKVRRDQVDYVATTGEGEIVDFKTGHFYGMTAHARGGLFLEPEARAVLDIGALHAKAILMDHRSKVLAYRMTSQCASGTGQFLENIARYLGVALEEVGELSQRAENPEKCSSICAVLAETDVINMVSRGIKTEDILKGIHLSMAGRLVKLLTAAKVTDTVVLTGGLASDSGLRAALIETLVEQDRHFDVRMHEDSILAGAIGAALWGAYRHRILSERGDALV